MTMTTMMMMMMMILDSVHAVFFFFFGHAQYSDVNLINSKACTATQDTDLATIEICRIKSQYVFVKINRIHTVVFDCIITIVV